MASRAPTCCCEAVEEGRVSEQRIDESARRLLIVKFQLGLFDDPFVDEDEAERIVGSEDFRTAGHRAQAESVVLLRNETVDDRPALPLAGDGLKVYVEGLTEEEAGRLGEVVEDPADADVAVVRVPAPYEPRDDLFLEGFFHQGSLAYRPGLVARLRSAGRDRAAGGGSQPRAAGAAGSRSPSSPPPSSPTSAAPPLPWWTR